MKMFLSLITVLVLISPSVKAEALHDPRIKKTHSLNEELRRVALNLY